MVWGGQAKEQCLPLTESRVFQGEHASEKSPARHGTGVGKTGISRRRIVRLGAMIVEYG
jgi:hypothetical protein